MQAKRKGSILQGEGARATLPPPLSYTPEGVAISKPKGITVNKKNLTIKYVLNKGLREAENRKEEKAKGSSKKVKHDEKQEEEEEIEEKFLDDDSGIESLIPVLFIVIFSRYILQRSPEKFGMLVEVQFLFVYWII